MARFQINKNSIFLISLLLLFSCEKVNDLQDPTNTQFTHYKVAVILPRSAKESVKRWDRTSEWFKKNIEQAQQSLKTGVCLDIEWHDESVESMSELGKRLANRDDIVAVIGPKTTNNLDVIADACYKTRKPVMAISVSSEDVIRRYAGQNFLWALTETDITQCEIMLSRVQAYGAQTVSLLAPDNLYGKTFYDWFAFQATELGLTPRLAVSYTGATRDMYIKQMLESDVDYVLCTPSDFEDVRSILEAEHARLQKAELCPELMFSDAAMTPEVLKLGEIATDMQGIAMYADPSSGFKIAYNVAFDESPSASEAQLYDALMLTAFAVAECAAQGKLNNVAMNDAILRITGNNDAPETLVWDGVSMQNAFEQIANKDFRYNISGTSGKLDFDEKVHTNVLGSIYCHWYLAHDFIPLGYYSSSGDHRVESSMASWNWKKIFEDQFENEATSIKYPPLNKQWALLVSTSEGWADYRHQADVLNMYQILKKNGIDDEHIILIMADDIAKDPRNTLPGIVKVALDGPNLYHDVQLDYCIDSLKPSDIGGILNGERSNHLSRVIESNANDNVLVFWSGHGIYGQLCWLKDRPEFSFNGFTVEMFRQSLQKMSDNHRYRKMLWLVEACHAESVTSASEGYPGVLTIAAALSNETSKADVWSKEMRIYLSNTFTKEFTSAITENPHITFRDLYYKLHRNTTASHVKITNAANFANLYTSSIDEFFMVDD